MPEPLRRKRRTLYPKTLSVPVSDPLFRDVEATADADDVGLAEIARASIEAGLPTVRKQRRKSRSNRKANGDLGGVHD